MGDWGIFRNLFAPCSQSLADFQSILPLDKIFLHRSRRTSCKAARPVHPPKQKAHRLGCAFQGISFVFTLYIQNIILQWVIGAFLKIYFRPVLNHLQTFGRFCLLTGFFHSNFSPEERTATSNPTSRKLSLNKSSTSGNRRKMVFRSQCSRRAVFS